MKNLTPPLRLFVFSLLCSTLLLTPVQAWAEDVELKVMSYNIRYGTANDGDNSWPNRREMVVRSIEKYTPDVFGVQECLHFQAEYLAETLKGYRWLGIGRDRNGTGEMTAIFYRHKDFVPVKYGNFWNSDTPDVPASKAWDTSMTRITTWVQFHHWRSGQHFYHYNTHLDHRGREARKESAKLIAGHIAQLPEDLPVVITGDFNAKGGDSDPWEAAIDGGLKDSWMEAETQVGPNNTWSGFTGPNLDAERRIDWVLFRGPLKALHSETVLYNEEGIYPSDHCAVFAKFLILEGKK